MSACARYSSGPSGESVDSSGKVPAPGPDRSNTWGGEHLVAVVGDTSTTLQYDCAHGTMSGAPKPDATGRFTAAGTHVFEHGGPVRADEPEDRHTATFTGRIRGSTMTLTVQVSGMSATLGPFSLERGDSGRLNRCY